MTLTQPQEQSFVTYAATIGRRKWVVVITVILAILAALGYDATRTRMFSSTVSMQLVSQNISPTNGYVVPLSATDIATAVNVATSSQVRLIVTKNLGQPAPPATASSVGVTAVVEVSVTTTKSAYSARVANLYGLAYITYTRQRFTEQILAQEAILRQQQTQLQNQIATLETAIANAVPKSATADALNIQLQNASSQLQTVNNSLTQLQLTYSQVPSGAVITSPAIPSLTPSSPKPVTDALVAGFLGLLIGIALTFVFEFFDDRIRDREHLNIATGGLPLLGEIPLFERWGEEDKFKLISAVRSNSVAAEAYRGLRTSIQFIGFDSDRVQAIQITSPGENDGKSTTAANLAVTLASGGTRIALIAADLRKPSLHRFFNQENSIGLSSYLSGTASLSDISLVQDEYPNLLLLPSGPIPPNPSELLGSKRMAEMLDALRTSVDLIIIDCPPILPVTDAVVIAQQADAVILIANSGSTHARDIGESLERLSNIDAKLDGVVLNGIPPTGGKYRYRYRYGNYRYGGYRYTYGGPDHAKKSGVFSRSK
jgi:capsular exopolysaccharide synthesis family protein